MRSSNNHPACPAKSLELAQDLLKIGRIDLTKQAVNAGEESKVSQVKNEFGSSPFPISTTPITTSNGTIAAELNLSTARIASVQTLKSNESESSPAPTKQERPSKIAARAHIKQLSLNKMAEESGADEYCHSRHYNGRSLYARSRKRVGGRFVSERDSAVVGKITSKSGEHVSNQSVTEPTADKPYRTRLQVAQQHALSQGAHFVSKRNKVAAKEEALESGAREVMEKKESGVLNHSMAVLSGTSNGLHHNSLFYNGSLQQSQQDELLTPDELLAKVLAYPVLRERHAVKLYMLCRQLAFSSKTEELQKILAEIQPSHVGATKPG